MHLSKTDPTSTGNAEAITLRWLLWGDNFLEIWEWDAGEDKPFALQTPPSKSSGFSEPRADNPNSTQAQVPIIQEFPKL